MRQKIILPLIIILTSCEKTPDIIKDQPPFINIACEYDNYEKIKNAITISSKNNKFDLQINDIDVDNGSFSIVMWKEDFNIILTGVFLEKRKLFYTGIARGGANEEKRAEANKILRTLPIKCHPAEDGT